ncbi:sensor histidine kinase, partial [Actinoplanes flavus]
MIAGALVVVPFAGHDLGVYPYFFVVFLVLMPTADLLTAHLLGQQFLADGRLATLGLSTAYLFSSMVMVPYAIAFTRMQRSSPDSTWSEVSTPWLGMVIVAGFPLLVAAQQWIVAALPPRWNEFARNRRRITVAATVGAAVTLAAAVTGLVIGAASWMPHFYQSGTPTAAGRTIFGVALLCTIASLFAVARNVRHRPPVERWVVVAISASLATALLTVAAPQRYTVGFYAARITLLVSSLVVLIALLGEAATLYRRLSAAHDDLDLAHRELGRRAEHLAVANRELEAADAWKSDILATLSHEINQPLTVISAYSEELTHDWDTTTDQQRRASVEALDRRVTELLDMAAHLLALCRAERGDIRTQAVALPVEQVLTRVTDNLTRQARGRVSVSCGSPGAVVWADPVHTHQVLANFVTNAVKYSPGAIHISATLDDTGARVLLAVSDEGEGVPPDFVAHLFDRFAQADRAGAARTGAGFGLYLSRLLADANHGDIWYEAVVPHGSRFVLALPSAPRSPEATTPVEGGGGPPPPRPPGRGGGGAPPRDAAP